MSTPGASESPRTAIILLNWNGWRDTLACLESLLGSDRQGFVAIVCDNGSSDDSWEQISRWGRQRLGDRFSAWSLGEQWKPDQQIVLIQTGANLGFAGGCNIGIRFALQQTPCEYLWLLNNDTEVAPNSLSEQVRRMERDRGLGLLGSTLIHDAPSRPVQCFGGYGFNFWTGRVRPFPFPLDASHPPSVPEVEQRLRYVSGASTFATRAFVEAVGLLNEQYFLYFEEIDWAVRGKGFRLSYCPESVVLHKEGRAIGSAASSAQRSEQSELWLTRNRVLFTRTYFPLRLPVAIAWMLVVALIRGLKHGPSHARLLLRGVWNGLKAPIRPLPTMNEWPAETLQAANRQALPVDGAQPAVRT
ncbi:glycosyltransferase family 2 protein [Terriglobus aquaticus]|uniref:Glycosyltransferase family 2 protein n=1 Tax=Terriglobus aquaticus TaxID=940139 RepID=A0ABW9KM19_9BACT|nr:glycosyltransferase family 2 protein [Terriglobus aquaticus]